MNRKAMALAVGAALAAPSALAQVTAPAGSSWELYGKFYPEMTTASGSGATPAGQSVATLSAAPTGNGGIIHRWEMQVSNTYFGFRANRDLGGGLKAIAQLETQVNIDQGDGNPLGNRDSYAGIAADWGTVRLGNMDTPFKKYGDVLGFLGVSSGNFVSANNVMRKVSNSGPSSFNLRRANSIDFASMNFSGLQFAVQYSIGNPTETSINPATNRNPRVISMGVKWEQGPFYAALAAERHFDLFGGSGLLGGGSAATSNAGSALVNSKDTAVQLTGVYKIGVHSIELDVAQKDYKEEGAIPTNGFQEYKHMAYEVVWEARWTSSWRTALSYQKATAGTCAIAVNSCSTGGMDANQYNVGVAYYFDPSTYLFALYARLNNGSSARYNNSSQAPSVGEDITQASLGIAYTF
jgi:predicted porin